MSDTSAPLSLTARVCVAIVVYTACMSVYYAAGFAARPPWLDISLPLDAVIPFVPAAMPGYALVYVMPAAIVFIEVTEAGLRRFMRAALLAYAIASPFFLLMPVMDADPVIDGSSWAERMLEWNRAADGTRNAFPSMHVALAVLLALVGWRRSRAWGLMLGACAAIIAASTLLVKQHFVLDIPAGVLVALVAHRVVYGKAAA